MNTNKITLSGKEFEVEDIEEVFEDGNSQSINKAKCEVKNGKNRYN